MTLDQVFWALSDGTRRDVVERLARGPATVTELAEPYGMSLPGFMKHLKVLEDAGLLARTKEGRTVRCELSPQALEEAEMWLARYRKFWTDRLDALGRFLYHQEETQAWDRKPTESTKNRGSGSGGTTRSAPKRSGGPGPTRRR